MVNRNQQPSKDDLEKLNRGIQEQFALEKWWLDVQRAQDLERNSVLMERGTAAQDVGVKHLIRNLSEQLGLIIEERLERVKRESKTERIFRTLLKSMQPYELAYLTLTTTVNTLLYAHKGFITLSALSVILADAVEEELKVRVMIALEPKLPKIVDDVLKESRAGIKHRHRVFITMFNRRCDKVVPSKIFKDHDARINVGKALLELLLEVPGKKLCEIKKSYIIDKNDLQWTVKPSEDLKDLFYRNVDDKWMASRTAPLGIMLNEPGERSPEVREMLMTRDSQPIKSNVLSGKPRATSEALADANMQGSPILTALTYLEQIPFRINSRMLGWVKKNKLSLQAQGVLSEAKKDIPDCPVQKGQLPKNHQEQEKFDDWKKLAAKRHNDYWLAELKVIKQNSVLALASKLDSYPQFYYRWCADFRGRLYPLNTRLHFQSSSLGKALLEFAEPVELRVGDPADEAWCELVEYGLRLLPEWEKKPVEEVLRGRVDSFLVLLGLIEDVLDNNHPNPPVPKNYLPFVAWALEVDSLIEVWGCKAFTHHPIRRDATCSSMQHMAAMAGDETVCKLTNVSHGADKVYDLYTEIVPDYKEQGLERAEIKQFIMTWAYNSTDYQRRKDLQASFSEQFGTELPYERAFELNDKLKVAATEGLGKIITLQELLMDVYRTRVTCEEFMAVSVTPCEFVVDSTKVKFPSVVYKILSQDTRICFRMKNLDSTDNKMNTRKTKQAWVANIIHSMDACLLHIALLGLANYKRTHKFHVAPIHDCVVTRPGEMAGVQTALAAAFQYMYSPVQPTGMSRALQRLVDFWDIKEEHPDLYKKFKKLKALPTQTFTEMRYFFV